MELWDVYDINRNKTGKTAVRGEGLPEGGYHLVVHVCIIGSDGRMLIQQRLLEPAGSDPDFTRGTLEGDIAASDITFYRLQCDSEGELRAYIAEGEILDVPTRSFGGIGIFAIPEMGRFYRHVLVEKRYPHHGAVAFGHYGKLLFDLFRCLGIKDIGFNQPKGMLYPSENPFVK